VLENVKNLLSSKRKSTFSAILKLLGSLKRPDHPDHPMYWVTWGIYNSRHYGVPQNRERLYIVGLRTSKTGSQNFESHNKKFTTMMNECVMETPDIRDFLGQLKRDNDQMVDELIKTDLRSVTFNNTAKKNLRNAMDQIRVANLDLSRADIVVDLGQGRSKVHMMHNLCPTITRTRAARDDFFLVSNASRITALDCMRLQGLNSFKVDLTVLKCSEIGQLAGNAMTIPLLASILRAALALTGLAKDSRSSTSTSTANGSSMSPSNR
jgi:site-specific DNA-cytosine methylase